MHEEEVWGIFIQIVLGLRELHNSRILHRDLKSANVFLSREGVVKLGDMNVSKVSRGLCETQTGTPYYASPEVWKDSPYDRKSDIWSLGCVLYEMAALKPPFRAEDMDGLFKKVVKGAFPRLPGEYSPELTSLVKALLQTSPASRPSCNRILETAAVQGRLPRDSQLPEHNTALIRTIKMQPLKKLQDNLPKANYEDSKRRMASISEAEEHQFHRGSSIHGSESVRRRKVKLTVKC
jgi:NIMA (never in mitosis gene a)-related kinase